MNDYLRVARADARQRYGNIPVLEEGERPGFSRLQPLGSLCCVTARLMMMCYRVGRSQTENRVWSAHLRHKLDLQRKDIRDSRPPCRAAL